MSQDEAGPRHVTVEGSEGSRQQRNEQESGPVLPQVQRSERVRSNQEKLGRDEMRRHGERRSECAGDRISVVAREKSRDSGWNRFVCCSDCVRSFSMVRNEKFCIDLSARKVKDKLRSVSFWYANPRMEKTCEVVVAVSQRATGVMMCHDESTQACAYHKGCGTKLELESNGVFELPVEIVLHNARTTGKNGNSGLNSSLSELEQIEDMTITIAKSDHPKCTVRLVERARLRSLVVGGNPGSRAVVCPISRVGLQQKATDGLRSTRESTTTRVTVSSGGRHGCEDRGDSVGSRFEKGEWSFDSRIVMEASRGHGHLEVLLDSACVMAEDRESWMYRCPNRRWVIARDKECENAQRCVNVDKFVNETITSNVQALMVVEFDQEVKFDQETSITDVKKTLTGELHSVGGSSSVSKESPMSASTANALIEKSVREMHSTVRTIVALLCLNLVVQFRLGLWRSWDTWSADLSQVLLI